MISRALRTSAAGVQAEKALTGVHTRRSGRAAGFSRPSAGGGFSRGRDCSGVLQAGVVPWRGGYGIFYGAYSFAHCISLRRAKGRDKVEATVGYVIFTHVDLLITFLLPLCSF